MAELKIQAPLAKIEDWPEFSDFQSTEDFENSNKESFSSPEANENSFVDSSFSDAFSTSLEDLVNTFDDKITKCFYNYEENVEKLAPVQVRTQEEIMNECQMWWTLTGNFGNILPIDWTKSCAKKLQHPSLNLNQKKDCDTNGDDISKDLDMHSIIINNLQNEPMFTAEQVLDEIEEMIQQQRSPSSLLNSYATPDKSPDDLKSRVSLYIGMYKDEVKVLSLVQLHELFRDIESLIQEHSETLIRELALRDELEFEKELKNSFISLILSIQNKRRQHNIERKKGKAGGTNGMEPKYLTTIIPYDGEHGVPDNATLQILIKILQAINDDSPTVPTLLTDYILKVLCPT